MAITASAKKAIKRSTFLREVNLVCKTTMKKSIKSLKDSAKTGVGRAELEKMYLVAQGAIDKAVKKNIIHKNNAARKKSGLKMLVAQQA